MTKPANLIYGVSDKPPLVTSIILALQHIFIMFIAIIFPVVIINALGGKISEHNAESFVSLSILAGGLGTILQALKFKKYSSGYLCPAVCGPSYLSASISAATLGGLPLLFGMTAFVGVVETLFSRVMHKLRALFPTEVTGTVVALVGIVIIPVAARSLVGIGMDDKIIETREVIVGVATLVIMVGLNVFSKGKLRLFGLIIGMLAGYALAFSFGILNNDTLDYIEGTHLFSVPYIKNMSWDFDFTLIIPFTIAALSSTLKTIGDISTCQKINDSTWKRVDMKSASGGIFADGMGGIIPGLIGGFGQSTSSSNVGLSVATGATSRVIAYIIGALMIVFAFSPRLASFFIIMPEPVMGAALFFALSFMIVQGFQMIMSRMLDSRKIFVIGISLIFGLSADMTPEIYKGVHPYIQPIFSSSLSLGAVSAVVLNLLLRIGINKHAKIALPVRESGSDKIFNFMEKNGQIWGARPEVISKVSYAISEAFEIILLSNLTTKDIIVNITFNEMKIDVSIDYEGKPFVIDKTKPDLNGIETDDHRLIHLSGYLLNSYCNKISISEKHGVSKIRMHFDH